MQNIPKTTIFTIALLMCHSCALVPALVSTSSEVSPSPSSSTIPDCLGSLPNLPIEQIRKGESSADVEAEADELGLLGKGQEALNKYSEAHTLYFKELGRGVGKAWADGDLSAAMEVNRSPETPEFLFKVGSVFAQTGQHQAAIGCFTEALNQRIEAPNDANAYMSRGNSYAQIGGGENARQDYQKSADLFKKHKLPQYEQLALNKLRQTPNKNKPGVTIPTPQIQTIDEKYKKTCYADALTESQGREITEASGALEAAADKLAIAGKHKEAIGKYNESAAATLNEAITDGRAEDMEVSAIWHNWRGEGVEGFKKENQALLQKSAESNFKIGSSYARLGQFEQAIDCFNSTIKFGILPPNDAIAYLNRGDTYERMGQKEKAKTDFQQAVNLFKKHKLTSYQKDAETRLRSVSN